jgi:hypothetical protein
MSKSAIATQAEHVADGRSVTAIAVLPAVDESSGYAVETDGYGARSPFTGARLAFTLARWGAA